MDEYFARSFFATTFIIATLLMAISWPILLFLQGQYDFAAPTRYVLMALPFGILSLAHPRNEFIFLFSNPGHSK
jgi:hypothetical protein